MWELGTKVAAIVLLPCVLIAISGDVLRWRSKKVAVFINRIFGPLMRPSEQPKETRPVLNGATSILIAALLSVLIFPVKIAATAIAITVVADAAAALIGRQYGRKRFLGGHATRAGSAAFLISGTVVAVILGLPPLLAVLVLVIATIVEALPLPINDNIIVPLAMATFLTIALELSTKL
jgi:dolichol kinase